MHGCYLTSMTESHSPYVTCMITKGDRKHCLANLTQPRKYNKLFLMCYSSFPNFDNLAEIGRGYLVLKKNSSENQIFVEK